MRPSWADAGAAAGLSASPASKRPVRSASAPSRLAAVAASRRSQKQNNPTLQDQRQRPAGQGSSRSGSRHTRLLQREARQKRASGRRWEAQRVRGVHEFTTRERRAEPGTGRGCSLVCGCNSPAQIQDEDSTPSVPPRCPGPPIRPAGFQPRERGPAVSCHSSTVGQPPADPQ